MRDPVLLRDSGISYERNALEWALHREPGLCPVSGLVLTDQTVYEDADLRRRIESWAQVNRPELVVRTYTVHLKCLLLLWFDAVRMLCIERSVHENVISMFGARTDEPIVSACAS